VSDQPQSPWLARQLLTLLLPPKEREFLIGDLEETFDARLAAGSSTWAARRWYWRATFNNLRSVGGRDGLERDRRLEKRQGDGVMKNLLRDARYGLRLLLHRARRLHFAVGHTRYTSGCTHRGSPVLSG
jgi:hypothetical protein